MPNVMEVRLPPRCFPVRAATRGEVMRALARSHRHTQASRGARGGGQRRQKACQSRRGRRGGAEELPPETPPGHRCSERAGYSACGGL